MDELQEAIIRTVSLFSGTYLAMRWSLRSKLPNDQNMMILSIVFGIILAHMKV